MNLLDIIAYLKDPNRTQQVQGLGGLLEDTLSNMQRKSQYATNVMEKALPDPSNLGKVGDRGAYKEAANMAFDALSFAPAGLTVYHGSPAKFTQFDASKIGSGEGAQAYGYGHYVAESPDVAKEYRDKLTIGENYVNGELFDAYNPKHYLASALNENSGNVAEAKDFLEFMASSGGSKSIKDTAKSALDLLKKGESPKLEYVKPSGSFYEIDLPDEQIARMLDWDKPFNKQPKNVQEFFANHPAVIDRLSQINAERTKLNEMYPGRLTNPKLKDIVGKETTVDSLKGSKLYEILTSGASIGKDEAARVDAMRQAGVPGIRYLDQGSRGVGEGTRNFVVFPGNEGLLTIQKRNNEIIDEYLKKSLLD